MQVKKKQLEQDMEKMTDSELGKMCNKGVPCHPGFLNVLYSEYIMWNAQLDESWFQQSRLLRIINNLRYADDMTLMAESEEELKSLLMRVKELNETQH